MADAGAIGTYRGAGVARPMPIWGAGSAAVGTVKPGTAVARPLPVWIGGDASNWHKLPVACSISGTVFRGAVPAAGAVVRLYDRISGLLVNTTQAADDGSYRFPVLNAPDRYYVVALQSPRAAPDENAVIGDYLTPV